MSVKTAKRTYSSDRMAERRRRMIVEARRLLNAHGDRGLTIESLCEKAEVAPRTIYRNFGDKDGVICAVMAEYMGRVFDAQARRATVYSYAGVFEELDWLSDELVKGGRLARVMVEIYLSIERKSAEVVEVLRSVSKRRFDGWAEWAKSQGSLRPGAPLQRAFIDVVDFEYVIYRRYFTGQIRPERIALDLKANFLRNVVALVKESERASLVRRLNKISRAIDQGQ